MQMKLVHSNFKTLHPCEKIFISPKYLSFPLECGIFHNVSITPQLSNSFSKQKFLFRSFKKFLQQQFPRRWRIFLQVQVFPLPKIPYVTKNNKSPMACPVSIVPPISCLPQIIHELISILQEAADVFTSRHQSQSIVWGSVPPRWRVNKFQSQFRAISLRNDSIVNEKKN